MATFELNGNQLKVSGALDPGSEDEVRQWCLELFLGDAGSVSLDLSEVTHITSACIGALVTLWIDLCAAKRGMEIVTSPAVSNLLDLGGLTNVFRRGAIERESEGADEGE